jgi:hypothetical protein
VTDAPPTPARRRNLVFLAVGLTAAVPCLLCAVLALALDRRPAPPDDSVYGRAITAAVNPPGPSFAQGRAANLLIQGSFEDNFDLLQEDLQPLLDALAPLGPPPYQVTVLEVTSVPAPERGFLSRTARCRVQGSRATREVDVVFEPHEVTLGMWWTLRRAVVR